MLTITIFFIINYLIFENIVPKELILDFILEKLDLKLPHFTNIPKTIILENNDETNVNDMRWKFTNFNQSEVINEKNLLENIQLYNEHVERIQSSHINIIYNCIVLIFSFIIGIVFNVLSESVRIIYPIESTNRKIDIHIINYLNFTQLIRDRLDGINERLDNMNQLNEILNHRIDNLQNQIEFLQNIHLTRDGSNINSGSSGDS
jgi:hypothetical protein